MDADVYKGSLLVAHLERTQQGSRLSFVASAEEFASGPVGSLSTQLPWQSDPIETQGANLDPFFLNLLPEGARLL